MAIVRWDPFGELMSIQREMDRLFGRLGLGRLPESASEIAWMPRIDVKSTGDDMVVYAELPGMSKDDISVEVTDGVLTIKGERKAETEKSEEGWLIRERSYGAFERSLALPEGVEPDKITADYKDGVLEVHIPKAMAALKPKTHKIALGEGKKK
ncbi:Hsp20/alpha crystallin family protein [Coriobacteriia bacterium Es71-Z0120]|uniref:Hsp20/alpha crystallin family protein n=1 Tax=Parvivirga hydrogeniphila TaxID=2939460 RepID=UPI002260DEED|nr:Hsp20/alpha crystallin family protein [Parvivirga hydrogeniphila]MCL4078399.1 Hsp20/alpha crystallin family protein [Parvivirga hydrogeniphila]